jgi:hypothetical protein
MNVHHDDNHEPIQPFNELSSHDNHGELQP